MPNNFQQVDYSQFRQALQSFAGQRVRNKGKRTIVYDHNNRMLAVLAAGSIDLFGKSKPTQYFVRHAA